MKISVKAVAFDLDGTIYVGNTLVPGADETVKALERAGIKVFYFTNNSVKTRKEVFEKLSSLGLCTEQSKVYNSAYAASIFIKEHGFRKVCCIGSEGLKSELVNNGIILDDRDHEAVVVGLYSGFGYKEIAQGLNALKKGAVLVACNRDRNYPVEGGRLLPGCGPLVAAIECAAGKKAKYIVGKPNTFMMELLAEEHGIKGDEIVVVGDTYSSDIAMARKYKCANILISSKTKVKNTIVISKLSDILKILL
jgi:HAD superfamily hydrolase (TIGR01450 family)